MDSIASVRRVAVFLLAVGGVAGFGQSALPPTSPTAAAPAGLGAAAPAAAGATAGVNAAHRASVAYTDGKLGVVADNSSLNQILRDIARATGMKITGGVNDERVFGKYGPAAPADVLTELLDGTDTNMLLKESANRTPAELILSPRQGGPTPPNPNAPGFNDESDQDAAEQALQQQRQEQERQQQMQQLQQQQQAGQPTPPAPSASAPAPAANAQPGTGVRTPQDIYQQLQQLQQQQRQQQQTPPPSPQ